jgi:KipI family sensor histidine kinase inhibitor
MRLIPVGPAAVLVELEPDDGSPVLLAQWARDRLEVDEVVPAAATVLLDGLRPAPVDTRGLEGVLAGWTPAQGRLGSLVEVEAVFDGPDLADVAERAGLRPDEVVDLIAATEFTSSFCGFAPGFSYLTGLPERLQVARRATPRTRVEAGSVAVAGEYAGIYPTASPGGWQLLGRTEAVLFDADRVEPALLPPGTRVRFVPR